MCVEAEALRNAECHLHAAAIIRVGAHSVHARGSTLSEVHWGGQGGLGVHNGRWGGGVGGGCKDDGRASIAEHDPSRMSMPANETRGRLC
jgi:hypothetical protein